MRDIRQKAVDENRHRGFACSALSPELAYHSFFLIAQVLFEG